MDLNATNVNTFLVCFIIGIFIALAVQFFSQKVYGKFVKKLIDGKCFDELYSKTLADLGYEKNLLIKHALKRKTTLSLIVDSVKGDDGNTRYFIPEEHVKKAENLCRADGFTLVTVLVLVLCLAAVFFICKYVTPYIFK